MKFINVIILSIHLSINCGYRESDLANRGYYLIAQELVYQWLGAWVSPFWWSDAHVNKAIAGFLAANTANEVSSSNSLFCCLMHY